MLGSVRKTKTILRDKRRWGGGSVRSLEWRTYTASPREVKVLENKSVFWQFRGDNRIFGYLLRMKLLIWNKDQNNLSLLGLRRVFAF